MADNIYLKYGESLSDAEFEAGAILFAKKDKAIAFDDPSSKQRLVIARDGDVIGPDSSQDGAIPIFSGTTGKIIQNSNYFPSDFAKSDHTHNLIPEGEIISTFTGREGVATGKFTPQGEIEISFSETGEINYTPSGTVTIDFTPEGTIDPVVTDLVEKNKSINEITDVGALPSFSVEHDTSNATLIFNWNAGRLPTLKTTEIHNGYEITKSAPGFIGTSKTIIGEFKGDGVSVSSAFVGKDGVIECTFTPTGDIESSFIGTEINTSTPN